MLNAALLQDGRGDALLATELTRSSDWSDVDRFCCKTYMPMQIRPLERGTRPDAVLRRMEIGAITFSRFRFGVPTRTEEFDPAAGRILVVNTLRGQVSHPVGRGARIETLPGDSYVVDCSRADYWNQTDGGDLQLNLTIPHRLMADMAERWFGFVPDDRLWKARLVFGGRHSAWLVLLDYATRSLDARHGGVGSPLVARQIEEMLAIELLRNWADGVELDLETGARAAAPRYVRDAERMMAELVDEAPTVTEIAARIGISARSLSSGFRQFRGITPLAHLTALRLDALHEALLSAEPGATVASIASGRGYVNLGAMTANYRGRFGETPAQTLRRSGSGGKG